MTGLHCGSNSMPTLSNEILLQKCTFFFGFTFQDKKGQTAEMIHMMEGNSAGWLAMSLSTIPPPLPACTHHLLVAAEPTYRSNCQNPAML